MDAVADQNERAPWRQLLDVGAACEHAGMTDRALSTYMEAATLAGSDLDRAETQIRIANLHRVRSQWDESRHAATAAHQFATRGASEDLAAEALNVIVGIHIMRGELDEAAQKSDEAFPLVRSPRVRGIALHHKGTIAGRRGDVATARRHFDESIAQFRDANYEIGIAYSLINAAMAAQDAGELNRALELGDEAIAQSRAILAHDLLVTAIQNQSHVMVKLGWFERAQSMLTEAFGFFTTARNPIRQAECLEIMGELNTMRDGDLNTARLSFARAKELAENAGDLILTQRLSARLEKLSR